MTVTRGMILVTLPSGGDLRKGNGKNEQYGKPTLWVLVHGLREIKWKGN